MYFKKFKSKNIARTVPYTL